jgi:RNA polymerase sigma-70 factor (ECF subfamily)
MDSTTTTQLLTALGQPGEQAAWRELDRRYRPILRSFSRRIGLSSADAEDVAQETLTRVYVSFRSGTYHRERGRLRSWLFAIARNTIHDGFRVRAAQRISRGESVLIEMPADQDMESWWNEVCERELLQEALRCLREDTQFEPDTLTVFERVGLREESPATVAAELGMSVDSVYAARSRCVKRLRMIIEQLTACYELA